MTKNARSQGDTPSPKVLARFISFISESTLRGVRAARVLLQAASVGALDLCLAALCGWWGLRYTREGFR